MLEHPKIDDIVYYFARSDSHDYPDLCKGYVKAILEEAGMVRVRTQNSYDVSYNEYVEIERCFTNIRDLLADLKQHVDAETVALEGQVYEW